jgi:hypothetical protein
MNVLQKVGYHAHKQIRLSGGIATIYIGQKPTQQ